MDLKSIINLIKRCQYIRVKNICFDINAYLLSALLCVGCKATWNNPVVERNENDSPKVLSVAFSDTATVVEMEKQIGYGFTISDESTLITDDMTSVALRWKQNLPKFTGGHSDSIFRFKLAFDAIPKGTKRLDFVEGTGEKDFRIWGIRPKGKRVADYTYNPSVSSFKEEDMPFLRDILSRHLGKVIVLQVFDDIDQPENTAALLRTAEARNYFVNDARISFVTIARPNKKEYSEGTARAIFLGKTAAYIEFLSDEEYEQFASIVSPYISKNKTICLDQTLQILSPGLIINSTKHLEKQLEIITK